MNLSGSIDLLKLSKSCVATLKGVRCVIIPVDENDIFVTADEATLGAKGAYLSVGVYERREEGKFGATHYAKQSFSRNFKESNPQIVEERKKNYLGDFKPFEFEQQQAKVPEIEVDGTEDLPF